MPDSKQKSTGTKRASSRPKLTSQSACGQKRPFDCVDMATSFPPSNCSQADIGLLFGETHSYLHDLESFFRVLFWICIHYDERGTARVVPTFEQWHCMGTDNLARLKCGFIGSERLFLNAAEQYFTFYYKPLVPCLEITKSRLSSRQLVDKARSFASIRDDRRTPTCPRGSGRYRHERR